MKCGGEHASPVGRAGLSSVWRRTLLLQLQLQEHMETKEGPGPNESRGACFGGEGVTFFFLSCFEKREEVEESVSFGRISAQDFFLSPSSPSSSFFGAPVDHQQTLARRLSIASSHPTASPGTFLVAITPLASCQGKSRVNRWSARPLNSRTSNLAGFVVVVVVVPRTRESLLDEIGRAFLRFRSRCRACA